MSLHRARMAEELLAFARLAPKAHNHADLLDELLVRVRPFGVENVAASVTTDAKRDFKFGPAFGRVNMAWAETYFREKLYLHDPIMAYALKAEASDYWDRVVRPDTLSREAKRVMDMADSVGVSSGFLTPVPIFNGDVVVVSFQGRELDYDPDVGPFLRGMAMYFGTEGQRIIQKLQAGNAEIAGLTERQVRVMHLVQMGYTAKEIAEEMGISHRTVEFHRDRARARLGASNLAEASAILAMTPQNLFTPS